MKAFLPPSIFALLLLLPFGCQRAETVEKEVIIEKTVDPDAVPGMMHTVYVWLRDDLTEDELQEFTDDLRRLEAIESVDRAFIGGPAGTAARGVVDNTFDYALILWFDDVAAHDAYQTDQIHLDFVANNEDKWTRVVVRDNEVL